LSRDWVLQLPFGVRAAEVDGSGWLGCAGEFLVGLPAWECRLEIDVMGGWMTTSPSSNVDSSVEDGERVYSWKQALRKSSYTPI
jgi:hypothetical protein